MALGFDDLQETVIVIHPVAKDEWGDPVAGTAVGVTVAGCLFAPGATGENQTQENQVQADATLYLDPQTTTVSLSASDRISIRGEVYEVYGKPRYYNNYFYEIPVRLVTG